MMNIEHEVRALIAKRTKQPIEKCVDGANLKDDLGADSLDHMELAFEVEEFFSIDVTDDELSNIRTVKDAITLVMEKINA